MDNLGNRSAGDHGRLIVASEQTSLQIGDAPVDVSATLEDGTYVAQVRGTDAGGVNPRVLYVAAVNPPADPDHWFQLTAGQTLRFSVGTGVTPVWFRRLDGALPLDGHVRVVIGPSSSSLSQAPLPSPVVVSGVTVMASELATFLGIEEDRAGQLLDVTSCLIADYAPRAPTPLQNEAVRRLAGYLSESSAYTAQSERVGDLESAYVVNHAAAFRNSGAAMLLTRWKIRRAGAIG